MARRLKTGEFRAAAPMSVEGAPMSVEGAEPALSTSASTESVAVDETIAAERTFCIVMPPGHQLKNYGELDSYLKQSDLIHKAFKYRFGMKEGITASDDVGTDSQLSDFLSTIKDKRDKFKTYIKREMVKTYPDKVMMAMAFSEGILQIAPGSPPSEGECILLELFFRALLSKLNDIATNDPKADLELDTSNYGNAWKVALKSLKIPSTEDRFLMPQHRGYQENVKSAFDSEYHDHMNARDFYVERLLDDMTTWQTTSGEYNAPYTSLINASMMGKSRLVKQISDVIPTVYMCVRNAPPGRPEIDDGYPKRSPEVLHDYLKNHPQYDNKTMNHERYSVLVERYYMGLFVGILHAIRDWAEPPDPTSPTEPSDPTSRKRTRAYDPNMESDLHLLRQRLWYHLAEPDKPCQEKFGTKLPKPAEDEEKEGVKFWATATGAIKSLAYTSDETGKVMTDAFIDAWEAVRPYLSVGRIEGSEPRRKMLLIVWDEARSLVEQQIPYLNRFIDTSVSSPGVAGGASRFIMIRRALRTLGRSSPRDFEIFNVFTDTTSRIGNFQPSGDTDSARAVKRDFAPASSRMFRPIVLLPGIDSAAYHLKVTVRSKVAQQPYRLLRFGRPAWSLYANTREDEDYSLLLAKQKLFRAVSQNLAKLFDPKMNMEKDRLKIYDSDKLRFLACVCSRLAIQTGSYVTATSELVSSHMMALLRVGDNHDQLESSYLSEPVLAEAAAEATGNYGWVLPLQTLVTEMRAGVVSKGFRGEFITRALVMIAMEDAQRTRMNERAIKDGTISQAARDNDPDRRRKNREYWDWSQVVTVRSFLDALLQDPDLVNKRSDSPPPLKRVKRQKSSEKFDDAPHDDDANVDVETPDKDPEPLDPFRDVHVPNFLKNAPKEFKVSGSIETVLEGRVFFNHWLVLEYPQIRPSTIVKAWNRCAALVLKDGARGADFLIPVLLKEESIPEQDLREFDNLQMFGKPWTIAEEKLAEKHMAYILIQTKNRQDSYPKERKADLAKCIPVVHTDSKVKIPSFELHRPQNPFISILMDIGVTPSSAARIEDCSTSFEASAWAQVADWDEQTVEGLLEPIRKEKRDANTKLDEAYVEQRKNQRADRGRVRKVNSDPAIQKIKENIHNCEEKLVSAGEKERARICSKLQIPIVVLGLDSKVYKCLENRKNVERILNALLDDTRDPLRGLPEDGVLHKLLRTEMHLRLEPEKDGNLWPLPA